jgi:hypothetical protein
MSCSYFILPTLFISTIALLLITHVTAEQTAWMLQPVNLIYQPADAATLLELDIFYAVIRT